MAERLFRVYVHTQNDESIRELVVTAEDADQAKERALKHVKASNPTKGTRSKAASRRVTKILAVTPTSKKHCLAIHSIPAAVVDNP